MITEAYKRVKIPLTYYYISKHLILNFGSPMAKHLVSLRPIMVMFSSAPVSTLLKFARPVKMNYLCLAQQNM